MNVGGGGLNSHITECKEGRGMSEREEVNRGGEIQNNSVYEISTGYSTIRSNDKHRACISVIRR